MQSYQWIYLAQGGNQKVITLYHSPQKGNFILFIDRELLAAEGGITDTYTYTFFIDEELCHLSILNQGNHFSYSFTVNKEVNTPLNQSRRNLERRNMLQTLLLTALLLSLALATGFGIHALVNHVPIDKKADYLAQRGTQTTAVLFYDPQKTNFHYSFIIQNKPYTFTTQQIPGILGTAPNWREPRFQMPLVNGDAFSLVYLQDHPEIHDLQLHNPTPLQIDRFKQRAAAVHASKHVHLGNERARCQLEQAIYYLKDGAIPLFYYQTATPSLEAPYLRNNKVLFDSLLTYQPYLQAIEGFCPE